MGIVVGLVLFGLAGWYFRRNRDDFIELFNFNAWYLVAIMALNILTRFLIGVRLRFLTRPFGVDVGLLEGAGLSIIQGYGNVVAIKGGTAGVAWYLYRNKGLGIDRFLAILAGGFVITALTASAAGLVGLVIVSWPRFEIGPEIPLFFVLMFIAALALIIFPRVKLPETRLMNFLNKVADGWNMLRSKWSNIFVLAGVELAILMSFALRYWVAFRAFSQPVSLSKSFLLAPPAYMSFIVNVTPAGMGVREPLLAYMSGILGYTVKGGLGAAVLDSAVFALLMLVLGPVCVYLLIPRRGEGDDDETS